MVTSKQGRMTVLMSLQQLWLPVLNMCKIEPVNLPSWREKGSLMSPAPNYGAMDSWCTLGKE